MTSRKEIKSVVIVGGGTAGWISACHLAKKLNVRTPKVQVMLVESPNIPTIGVGEGTVPMLRETLKYFGIREDEFIRCCDVTFKQSVKFIDWNKPNSGQGLIILDHFSHVIFKNKEIKKDLIDLASVIK